MNEKTKKFYRRLADPANPKTLNRALRIAAKRLVEEQDSLEAASSSAFLLRLKGGLTAQVFVKVGFFNEALLKRHPNTGGLLEHATYSQLEEVEGTEEFQSQRDRS